MKLEHTLPDALADALGKVVADCKREWERELETLRAERRALIAELRLVALGGTTEQPAAADSAKGSPHAAPAAKHTSNRSSA